MAFLKKKPVQAAIAATLAAAIVLGGTFAWNSFNQNKINVFKELVAPDVNLHDDFEGGPNKDVYVENSGQADIYVRVRLTEFLQTENKGSLVEGHVRDDDKAYLWAPHNATGPASAAAVEKCVLAGPNHASAEWAGKNFHDYYTWFMGGQSEANPTAQIYYKPATEEQKGEYGDKGEVLREPAVVSDPLTGTSEAGDASVDYTALVNAKIAELKAADTGEPKKTDDELKAAALAELGLKETQTACVITMEDWKKGTTGIAADAPGYRAAYAQGDFWVIDQTDGWAYWANPLHGGSATGLLLDKVERTDAAFDSNAEYAVNAWLQAVDETDFGQFAANGGGISKDGEKLLQLAAGKIALAADGKVYANNGDGTYLYTEDADGTAATDAKPFVPLGEGGVNTAEANRLQIGQRITVDPLTWDGSIYTDYVAKNTAGPWYNIKTSTVADNTVDNGKQIYEVVGTQIGADGQVYLRVQPIVENSGTYISDADSTMYLASVKQEGTDNNYTYSQAAPGTAPFGFMWPNASGVLGTADGGRLDPNVTLDTRSFSLLGNGVYLETTVPTVAAAAEGDTAAAPKTYFFAGKVLTTTDVTSASGTLEDKVNSLFPLQLTVGDKFDITGGDTTTGSDNKPVTAAVTGYTKADNGAYTMTDLVKGVDGNYYIYLGSDKAGYVGPGADKFLGAVKDGTVADARAWDGGMGIGSATDKAVYPGDFAEPFLAGKSTADLAEGGTFTADGKTWVVLKVDEYGNRLIMSQNHDVFSTFGANNTYTGSTLQNAMKTFTSSKVPTLKPYIQDAGTPVETYTTATGAWSTSIPVQEGALSYALATKNSPMAFALSQSEFSAYDVQGKTSNNGKGSWFWTRTPSGDGKAAVFYKTGTAVAEFRENTVGSNNACLPAMWVRFSDADLIATASAAQLDAWKSMPAVGKTVSFGNYPQNQAAETPLQPVQWKVLTTKGTQALLISNALLDTASMGPTASYAQYSATPAHTYLNGTFLTTAFSAEEQARIAETTVKTAGMADVQAKVFIPSLQEINSYGADLAAANTTYCKSKLVAQDHSGWVDSNYCWLRSKHTETGYPDFVSKGKIGKVNSGDFALGMRPMIWVEYGT